MIVLDVSIDVIVLFSESECAKEVEANTICSPITQSTGYLSLITELPCAAVDASSVQMTFLGLPCRSIRQE